MANNSYIGNYEYESPLGKILVKSRVYKNVDKQKKVLGYEVFQSTYVNGKLLTEMGFSGDPEWMDLTQHDIDNALPRKAKNVLKII
jgi:hypothetical protein